MPSESTPPPSPSSPAPHQQKVEPLPLPQPLPTKSAPPRETETSLPPPKDPKPLRTEREQQEQSTRTRPIPTSGLVAYYPFNGNAHDESGNGHHGEVVGASLTTDRNGKPNSAYSFNGVNNQINVPDGNGRFNVGDKGLTISLWIKFTGEPSLTVSFVTKSSYTVNTGYTFPYITRADKFGLITHTKPRGWDNTRSYSYKQIQNLFEWHFYAGTFDGTYRRVYIDEELLSHDYQAGNIISPNSNNLTIGNQPGYKECAKAIIDDIRIYNRALSKEELETLLR